MPGKFFDDWQLNEEFITPTRTVTETDVVMFAAMSGDYNELHTSEAFMKNTQFGRRIVHGLLGLAISHGLLFRTGYLEGTAIAFLGIDSWKFEAPLFFGETIYVKAKVVEKTPSKSKLDRGIIKLFLQIIKDGEVVVQSGYKTLMIKRK